jgi:hypothetical protein
MLTEPVRQSVGDYILDYADQLRNGAKFIYDNAIKLQMNEDYSKGIISLHRAYPDDLSFFRNALLKMMSSEEAKKDNNYVKLLAYHNKTTAKWNSLIRNVLYSVPVNKIELGEQIIVTSPIYDKNNSEQLVIPSNTKAKVIFRGIKATQILNIELQYYECLLESVKTEEQVYCNIIHENSEKQLAKILKILADRAKAIKDNTTLRKLAWSDFHKVKNAFTSFKYNYAVTVHTAQGSTIDNVFIDCSDINFCYDNDTRKRLAYVAVTRAKNRVFQLF